jgi:V/A-type H+-transporting ATPase subunit E
MEELRSTEILDREIQEDARRKAEKILKANEAECARIIDDVAIRIEKTRTEKEAEYEARLASHTRDSEAAIPLEKQRKLVTFIDDSVKSALDEWFEGIGKEKRLALYTNLLRKAKFLFDSGDIFVYYRGYNDAEIRALAESVFGAGRVVSIAEALSPGFADGLVVESSGGLIRCRATMDELRDALLSGKRQELAEALLGGRIPEWAN